MGGLDYLVVNIYRGFKALHYFYVQLMDTTCLCICNQFFGTPQINITVTDSFGPRGHLHAIKGEHKLLLVELCQFFTYIQCTFDQTRLKYLWIPCVYILYDFVTRYRKIAIGLRWIIFTPFCFT